MWAKYVAKPIVLMYVDFPPMLGPVNIIVLQSSKSQSFGMQVRTQGRWILVPLIEFPKVGRHQGD